MKGYLIAHITFGHYFSADPLALTVFLPFRFMPTWRHFFNRQNWHLFRSFRLIWQLSSPCTHL